MFDRSILKLKARDQFRRLITIVTAKIKNQYACTMIRNSTK